MAGLFFLYMAWPRKHSDTWIIPGMVLTLGGLVFLLANTVLQGQSLERIWPLFMLVTGLSLIPYGLRKKASARTAIMVPAVFISFLALFFLIFSLHREEGGLVAVCPAVVAHDPRCPRNYAHCFIFQHPQAE